MCIRFCTWPVSWSFCAEDSASSFCAESRKRPPLVLLNDGTTSPELLYPDNRPPNPFGRRTHCRESWALIGCSPISYAFSITHDRRFAHQSFGYRSILWISSPDQHGVVVETSPKTIVELEAGWRRRRWWLEPRPGVVWKWVASRPSRRPRVARAMRPVGHRGWFGTRGRWCVRVRPR